MKKKMLVLGLMLLAIPILTAIPVQAGKGQEKLDFLLHFVGNMSPPPEDAWPAGVTRHIRGLPFVVTGDFYIEIGEAGSVETIPKECLSYDGLMDININDKNEVSTLTVRETITIYTDATQSEERGTIEILTQGMNHGGKGLMVNGHGTGEFEGIKITGLTTVTPGPPPTLDRIGTVMGWPTP